MKKVKCIDTRHLAGKFFIEGKIYEVIKEYHDCGLILVRNEYGSEICCEASSFEEVKEEFETDNEESFKFIPLTEVEYITINGTKGILVKE